MNTPFNRDIHGSLRNKSDGTIEVIFNRRFKHPVTLVWQALTDPEQRQHWFPGLEIDLKLGGKFEIWFGGDCEGPAHVEGTVEVLEPPHVLQLSTMRFEIEETLEGCVLTFSDVLHFDDRPRSDFAVSVLGGWHVYMEQLTDFLSRTIKPLPYLEPDYRQIQVPGWELLKE